MKKTGAFAALKIVHTAMLAGQVLFIAILFFMAYSKRLLPLVPEIDKPVQVIAVLLSAAGFFLGANIFKKKLLAIRDDMVDNGIQEKFAKYRMAAIIQWAMLEGPCLFCCTCFFLVGNYAFLALAAALVLLFAMLAPVKIKAALQLGLSIADMEEL
jgi:hypothetical protein